MKFPTIRRLFGLAPKLRNKPGGMAWIKPHGHEYGGNAVAGQAVRTVRLYCDGMWVVEPTPEYVATCDMRDPRGTLSRKGDRVMVIAMRDDYLEPWRDDGVTDSEVTELFRNDSIADLRELADSTPSVTAKESA
jgi:hypothetical protein